MPDSTVFDARIHVRNDAALRRGRYVLYWMQQSQRADWNHALEYAIQQANQRGESVLVGLGLMEDYPQANRRHYRFMLEGLQETQASLADRGVQMVVQWGRPDQVALQLAEDASLVVCDRGVLREQCQWRQAVARQAGAMLVEVESDVVVPLEAASSKAEFAARTLRPKVTRLWPRFLRPVPRETPRHDSLGLRVESVDLSDVDALLAALPINGDPPRVAVPLHGGTAAARSLLESFLHRELPRYAAHRNQPQTESVSRMSAYLHFGQISPLEVALAVRHYEGRQADSVAAFLEELLVRRELAQNFVYYTPDYDRFTCIPTWAQTTLRAHRADARTPEYDRVELDAAATDDPYWNAAMNEMKASGYMHNYMRMYWGKKILQWSRSPEIAYDTALALNNRYFFDGRDASSYANVAWVFGLHDRPFAERPVYGMVRSMSASGLQRKCKIDEYVAKVAALMEKAAEREAGSG